VRGGFVPVTNAIVIVDNSEQFDKYWEANDQYRFSKSFSINDINHKTNSIRACYKWELNSQSKYLNYLYILDKINNL